MAQYVLHNPDGAWDFMCGMEDGHDSVDDAEPICALCAFDTFVTGLAAEDLSEGFAAERASNRSEWVLRPMSQEELSDEED